MNNEKQVILFPKGQLKKSAKKELLEHGFIAIEVEEPHKVITVIKSSGLITGDDMLMSALESIADHSCASLSASFVKKLYATLNNRVTEVKNDT